MPQLIPTVGSLKGTALYFSAMIGAGTGFLGFGFDSGIVNTITANPNFQSTFPRLFTNATLLGFVLAIFTLGIIIGALGNAFIANRWGRRDSILIGSLGMSAFSAMQTGASDLGTLTAARLLTGISAGVVLTQSPAYIAEMCRTDGRSLLLFLESFNSVGLMFSFWLAYPFSRYPGAMGWRLPSGLQVALSFLSMCIYLMAPESPRYLAEIGQSEKALHVLRKIHHSEEEANIALTNIEVALQTERTMGSGGFFELFSRNAKCYSYRTMCVYILNVSAQAAGVAVSTYYAGQILVSVGLVGDQITLALGGLGTAGCIGSFLGAGSALKFGRVRILAGTCAACALGFIFILLAVKNIGTSWGPPLGAFGIYFQLTAWSYGFLPIQAAYPAEIAPLRIRPQMISSGQAVQSTLNFLVVMASPKGFEDIGYWYYIVYVVAASVCCITVIMLFPETAGLPLEKINDLFVDGRVTMRRSPRDMLDGSRLAGGEIGSETGVPDKGEQDMVERRSPVSV